MAKIWGFGIIGSGGIAAIHRKAMDEMPNARLICVSSRTENTAKLFAQEAECEWTTDYHQLLNRSDIDIVCVTTSNGSHYRIGMDVILAGKHLIIEKPICMNAIEAQKLIDSAAAYEVRLSVISQRRFEHTMAYLKLIIDEGKLGKLMLIEVGTPYYRTQEYYDSADWRGTIAEDGGALMNQGIHQIDLMLWFGGPVHSVYGKTAIFTHEMEAEDMGAAIVKFTSGAIGALMSSTCINPGQEPFIHLYGEKGSVKIRGQSVVQWTVGGTAAPLEPGSNVSGGSSNPLAISYLYHQMQLEDIIHSIDQRLPMKVTGSDGKCAVELIESIYASSASGKEIILE